MTRRPVLSSNNDEIYWNSLLIYNQQTSIWKYVCLLDELLKTVLPTHLWLCQGNEMILCNSQCYVFEDTQLSSMHTKHKQNMEVLVGVGESWLIFGWILL